MNKPDLKKIEEKINKIWAFSEQEKPDVRQLIEALTGEKFPEPENPIELRAGDVWSSNSADGIMLVKRWDGTWHITGLHDDWHTPFSNGPFTDEQIRDYLKSRKRIGHIECKLVED